MSELSVLVEQSPPTNFPEKLPDPDPVLPQTEEAGKADQVEDQRWIRYNFHY